MSHTVVTEAAASTTTDRPAWGRMIMIMVVALVGAKVIIELVLRLPNQGLAGLLAASVPAVVFAAATVVVWKIRPRR